jgi:uncharacterized protein
MSNNYANFRIFEDNSGNECIYSGLSGLILSYNDRIKKFLEQRENDEELAELLFKKKESNIITSEKTFFDTLVLFITNRCNLACSYCYESSKGLPDIQEMDLETLKETLNYFLENLSHPRNIKINFFGGEPVLNISLIKHSMDLFDDFANKYNIRFTYKLITNGTIVDDELIEFLIKNSIDVQVSTDGLENVHNLHRKFPSGEGSYQTIVNNVKKLAEYCDVSARVTVTDFNIDLIGMYEELEKIGFSDIKIECVISDIFKNSTNKLNDFSNRIRLFADYFIDNIRNRKVVNFTNFLFHLRNIHFGGRPNLFPCQAGVSKYSIATDGSIYFCHRFNNIPQYKWGDVRNGFENSKRINFLSSHQITDRGNEKCKECWASQVCGGTCLYASYIEKGDTKLMSDFYCEFRKQIFEKALYIYASLSEEDKVFLDNIKTGSM